jgi:hypothetical protein
MKKIRGDPQKHRQEGDLISLLIKICGGIYRRIDRQQNDILSLVLFLQNKKS